ncbi:MAG TPA: hypothetical protein VE954_18670 [Oligoflexus sp.]|uniref:hypothetical protein n=1 Tax=Oligoflexus sp. TaxID=1971216 RepID=UPI002D6DC482|nr:hypothetical protein [Oligoflexus sp.]HYX35125.1 hypothetical protein [Oligoflexus sp.]
MMSMFGDAQGTTACEPRHGTMFADARRQEHESFAHSSTDRKSMKAVLQVWNVPWLKVVLASNGRFSLWQGVIFKGRIQGLAYRLERDWFAIYSRTGTLQFRKNTEEFSVNHDLRCAYERSSDGTRCLVLNRHGREVLRHRYRMIMNADGEEAEDFFLWAALLLNDKTRQTRMLEAWSENLP